MKTTIKSYTISLLFILLSTLIFSLVLTILNQNNLLSVTTSNITSTILSLSLFFIASVILGFKMKKKGLLNGIILSLIYISINLIIGFIAPGINNLAHIGGLIGGVLIAKSVGVKYKSSKFDIFNGILMLSIFLGFLIYMIFFR